MKKFNWSHPTLLPLVSVVFVVMAAGWTGTRSPTIAGSSLQGKAPVRFDGTGAGKPKPLSIPQIEFYKPSKAEQAIETALDSNSAFSLTDCTLADAVQIIAKQHNIQIVVLHKVLSNDGVNTDMLLNHYLKNIQLRNSLNIILKRFEPPLTYLVEDEVLKITTTADAEERLQTRVYGIGHLSKIKSAKLQRVLWTTSTGPWYDDPLGGEGIGGSMVAVHGGLVIRQNYKNHREIQLLLRRLTQQQADVLKGRK